MEYKGDDLDLRSTGQGGAPAGYGPLAGQDYDVGANGARPRQRLNGGQRPAALYVDDTLMAVCNHAYDLASANGAREVMLEHLVHALTRVPEAAQVLETRGVHVMALRRESAAIIANDLPISARDSGGPVRASADYDAVLKLAAANARRDRPTAVRDVLFVMMNYERPASGIDLLRRHWASWQQDEGGEPLEPPRTSLRPAYPIADYRRPQRAPVYTSYPGNDRVAEGRLEELVINLYDAVMELRADNQNLRAGMQRLEQSVEQGRLDGGMAALEAAIMSRLQRLEKMQETLLAQRSTTAPFEAAMSERFQRLDKGLEAIRHDAAKLPGVADKLQRLEKSIEGISLAMPAGLVDRMQAMERGFESKISETTRSWGNIGERLQGIERSLSAQRAELAHLQAGGVQIQALVNERFQAMELGFASWRDDGGVANGLPSSGMLDRLPGLERVIAAIREDTTRLTQAQEGEITELRSAVSRLGSAQQTLSAAIDQWRLDNTGDLGIISNRLEAIEHSSVRPAELLESLNSRVQTIGFQQQYQPPIGGVTRIAARKRGFWRWLFGLS